jgi:hypothetical protein
MQFRRLMIVVAVLQTVLLPLAITGCDPEIRFSVVNSTTHYVDVAVFSWYPGFDDAWRFYEQLDLGEVDTGADYVFREGVVFNTANAADIRNAGPGDSGEVNMIAGSGTRLLIVARDSMSRILLFKHTYTLEELDEIGWMVEVDSAQ